VRDHWLSCADGGPECDQGPPIRGVFERVGHLEADRGERRQDGAEGRVDVFQLPVSVEVVVGDDRLHVTNRNPS
jgi:hypothetical protein